jgi:hypothetical protein
MKRPELGWRETSRFRSTPLCKSVGKGLGRFVERLRSACRALRKHLHAVLWQASSARCYFPRRDAQRMAIQTRFTKKLTRSEDCNDRFLALLGNDRELDLALLDVKNRVRNLSL